MKTTSEQFKQAAVSPGRSVMVMIEWDGVLIHANDAGGSLISVAYDYPNETLIGGYSLASVEFTFLIGDSTARLIESHAPIYIIAGYYNVPDTVRIGPFTVIEDGIVTDNGTIYTITAMDAGVNADVKYIPIDFAIKPLTGNEVLDQLALQAGLTIHPDKPAMLFDDEIIMGVNAGYSNDVSVRTLISQYAQINLMKAVTVDGQLTFKSAFSDIIDLEITADSYTTSSIDSIVKPINSLVVSNAANGSDEPYQDIYVQDEASIELNGLTEFRIVNNRFTDIDPSIIFKMFEVLKNKTTMAYTITDYRMRPDLEPMDNVQLILPHEIDTVVAPVTSIHWEYDGGLNGELMSAGIEETLADYNLAGLAADVRKAIIRVNDVEGKINITVSNQEALEKQVKQNSAAIDVTENMIQQEVIDRQQMGDVILEEATSLVEQYSDSWNLIFTKIENEQQLTNDELTQFKTYFRWDVNGAIIGKEGSPIELYQTNNRIEFRENGIPFAYWEGGTMSVDNIIASISIVIGTHLVETYQSPVVGKSTTVKQVS